MEVGESANTSREACYLREFDHLDASGFHFLKKGLAKGMVKRPQRHAMTNNKRNFGS